MPFCKNCGNQLNAGQKFCNKCGTPVSAAGAANNNQGAGPANLNYGSLKCPICGAEIKQGQKFCNKCGSQIENLRPSGSFPEQAPVGRVPAYGYSSGAPASAAKSTNRTRLYIILASVSVLLVVLIVLGIIFLPGLLNRNNNGASAQTLAPGATDVTQSVTQPQPETAPNATAAPETQAPTQPQTQPPATTAANPNYYDQKIEVVSSGTSATLTLYEWQNGGWTSLMQTYATVGKNGVGYDYGEGKSVTPKGTFSLGFCYGLSAPNTKLRFKQLQSSDIFVSDSNSKYYNCLIPSSLYSGSGSIERTYNQFANQGTYNYNIFIEHNGDGETANSATPGLGSVITICGYTGALKPTLGCVDISSSDMIKLLSYLDQSKNPVIIIS